jgi:hypothetical protein
MNVSLRPLEERDLDTIYQQVTDPESVRLAAFTAEDQADRRAFLSRMSRLRAKRSCASTEVGTGTGCVVGGRRVIAPARVTSGCGARRRHWRHSGTLAQARAPAPTYSLSCSMFAGSA